MAVHCFSCTKEVDAEEMKCSQCGHETYWALVRKPGQEQTSNAGINTDTSVSKESHSTKIHWEHGSETKPAEVKTFDLSTIHQQVNAILAPAHGIQDGTGPGPPEFLQWQKDLSKACSIFQAATLPRMKRSLAVLRVAFQEDPKLYNGGMPAPPNVCTTLFDCALQNMEHNSVFFLKQITDLVPTYWQRLTADPEPDGQAIFDELTKRLMKLQNDYHCCQTSNQYEYESMLKLYGITLVTDWEFLATYSDVFNALRISLTAHETGLPIVSLKVSKTWVA